MKNTGKTIKKLDKKYSFYNNLKKRKKEKSNPI